MERLLRIDRRIIFAFVAAAVTIPLLINLIYLYWQPKKSGGYMTRLTLSRKDHTYL
jgi:hypothetical protein